MNYSLSYSDIRKNLKEHFDKVCLNHLPLLVTRKRGENVVIVSEEDYLALEETAYLSRSPKNMQRLLEALNRAEGKSLSDVKNELGI